MAFTASLALAEHCARQGQFSAGSLGGDASCFTAAADKVQLHVKLAAGFPTQMLDTEWTASPRSHSERIQVW